MNLQVPFRLWMSGSIAIVMASLLATRGPQEDERARRQARHSPFGVTETVQRIEAAALRSGLPVMARVEGRHAVLVLASSVGGTPLLQPRGSALPDAPMRVEVWVDDGGGSRVLLPEPGAGLNAALHELSPVAARELRGLGSLVDRALG
jgi:hypothetical protein